MRMLVLLSVLTLATACGSSGGDHEEDFTSSDARVYTEAELQEALLVLDDLPRGWKAGEDDDEEDDEEACGDEVFGEGFDSDIEANFQRSDFGPFFTETLTQLDEDEAEQGLDAFREALEECASFTQTDEDGTETEITLEEIDAPDLGDEAVAAEVTATTPLGAFVMDICVVRIDGTVASFFYGGFGGADKDDMADLAEQGVDKLLALD